MTQAQGWFGLWKNQFPWNWFSYFWCFKRCLVMHSVLVWGNELKLVISSKAFYLYFSFFSFLYLLNYWWSHFIKSTVVATNSSVRFPLSTTTQQLSLFVLHQVSFSMYIFKTWWSDNIHSHYNISIINGKNVTIYIHQSILEISDYLPIFLFLFPYDIRQLLGYYSIPSNEQGTSVLISRKYCTKWCFQIPIYEIESLDKFGRRLQCFHEFIRQCHGFGESDKKKFLISSVVKRKRLLKE